MRVAREGRRGRRARRSANASEGTAVEQRPESARVSPVRIGGELAPGRPPPGIRAVRAGGRSRESFAEWRARRAGRWSEGAEREKAGGERTARDGRNGGWRVPRPSPPLRRRCAGVLRRARRGVRGERDVECGAEPRCSVAEEVGDPWMTQHSGAARAGARADRTRSRECEGGNRGVGGGWEDGDRCLESRGLCGGSAVEARWKRRHLLVTRSRGPHTHTAFLPHPRHHPTTRIIDRSSP